MSYNQGKDDILTFKDVQWRMLHGVQFNPEGMAEWCDLKYDRVSQQYCYYHPATKQWRPLLLSAYTIGPHYRAKPPLGETTSRAEAIAALKRGEEVEALVDGEWHPVSFAGSEYIPYCTVNSKVYWFEYSKHITRFRMKPQVLNPRDAFEALWNNGKIIGRRKRREVTPKRMWFRVGSYVYSKQDAQSPKIKQDVASVMAQIFCKPKSKWVVLGDVSSLDWAGGSID